MNILFDGSNDRLIFPFNESLNPQPTDAFSVFFWFKNLGSSTKALLGNMNPGTSYSGWDLWRQSSSEISIEAQGVGIDVQRSSTPQPPPERPRQRHSKHSEAAKR